MSTSAFLLVRLVHVVSATLWVGGAVVVAGFVAPAIRAAGPAGGPVMRQLTEVRRLPYVLAGSGVIAILSGTYLMWVLAAGSLPNWIQTRSGQIYSLGAACAFVAAVIGLGFNIPTANRLGALAASMRNAGEVPATAQPDLLRRLGLRLATGTRLAAILLILATAAMATARYVA
jgi:uncharacterized membrane protein